MRILVIEDEKDLLEAICEGLRMDGYAVDMCDNGKDGEQMAYNENYDLILLDLNLPYMDGIDVLKSIRKNNIEVKIIVLSARATIEDKVLGLDLGANDYLTKPFEFKELEARIRSLLRRKFVQVNKIITCGNLSIDTTKKIAYSNDIEINLTKKEFSLLEYFMLNQDIIISQNELIEHVWDGSVDLFSNAIRVHIASLRKKIKAILNKDMIHNKIGHGYYLSDKGDNNE